jgi:Ca2+/Na+ antiporter
MVLGGERIARFYGVPEAIIGLTLFAFGTSLPELATSVVAALRKHGDIIVGNAVGSCIFNLLAVIGLAGLVAPLEGEGLTTHPSGRDAGGHHHSHAHDVASNAARPLGRCAFGRGLSRLHSMAGDRLAVSSIHCDW